jgi:hypothetical protein
MSGTICQLKVSLWNELIFKWFVHTQGVLFALRLVCKDFCDVLNRSFHWDFSLCARMRCDERLMVGFSGVQHARAREEQTRQNAKNGAYEFVQWPLVNTYASRIMLYVATRVVTCYVNHCICIDDYVIENATLLEDGANVMADRWIFYKSTVANFVYLFDCWTQTQTHVFNVVDKETVIVNVSGLTFAFEYVGGSTRIMRMNPKTFVIVDVRTIIQTPLQFGLCGNGDFYYGVENDHQYECVLVKLYSCNSGKKLWKLRFYTAHCEYADLIDDRFLNVALGDDDNVYADRHVVIDLRRGKHIFTTKGNICEWVRNFFVANSECGSKRCFLNVSDGQRESPWFKQLCIDHSGTTAFIADDGNYFKFMYKMDFLSSIVVQEIQLNDISFNVSFKYGVLLFLDNAFNAYMIRCDMPVDKTKRQKIVNAQ